MVRATNLQLLRSLGSLSVNKNDQLAVLWSQGSLANSVDDQFAAVSNWLGRGAICWRVSGGSYTQEMLLLWCLQRKRVTRVNHESQLTHFWLENIIEKKFGSRKKTPSGKHFWDKNSSSVSDVNLPIPPTQGSLNIFPTFTHLNFDVQSDAGVTIYTVQNLPVNCLNCSSHHGAPNYRDKLS